MPPGYILKLEIYNQKGEVILMAKRKYGYDSGEIEKIYRNDQTPNARNQLYAYLEGLFPVDGNPSEDEERKRREKITMAFMAAKEYARCHGWLKSYHNPRANVSLWPDEKKKLFGSLFESGVSAREISTHREFHSDFMELGGDVGHAMHNFAKSLACDRAKRKLVLQKRKEELRIKRAEEKKKGKAAKKVDPPNLEMRRFSEPAIFEIPREIWEEQKDYISIGMFSRVDWKDHGARAGLIELAYERVFVDKICRYLVCVGGLISKRDVGARIDKEMEKLSPEQKREYKQSVIDHVCAEMANELHSILPIIKVQKGEGEEHKTKFVKLYIITSQILDGKWGKQIVRLLQTKRQDIVMLKHGGDKTYLKGIGDTEEEKKIGQTIEWLIQKKNRLPGSYASTPISKEVREEEDAVRHHYPKAWGVGGFGSSISKPGGGEVKIPIFSIPASSVPIPREEGEPSPILNQIGVRIVKIPYDKSEMSLQTWSFSDLIQRERTFVKGIKESANDIQKRIVEVLKLEPGGLYDGQLADLLDISREELKKEIAFLIEPKALKRTTWPGLYWDNDEHRYNFHNDWFQERLRYPWPYDKDHELRRLLMGCLHVGYNTTDYFFLRQRVKEIILRFGIRVLEILGDLVAGLKHHMIHKGQNLGNIGYTESEIFCAEIIGTIIYEVFVERFENSVRDKDVKSLSDDELVQLIRDDLLLLIYIMGNHDEWQLETGHIPGVDFRLTLLNLLDHYIAKYLHGKGIGGLGISYRLREIIGEKILGIMPGEEEYFSVYEFEKGVKVGMVHPGMARAKTLSLRAEEVMEFLDGCVFNDFANFHVAFVMEKWQPDLSRAKRGLGQREATSVGAMTPFTYFENGKLKRVDFGVVYRRSKIKDGRVFMSEHMFFNKPLLKKPLSKNTDIDELKKELGILRVPGLRM